MLPILGRAKENDDEGLLSSLHSDFRIRASDEPNGKEAVRDLHNQLGHDFQLFRAWGFHGRVGGVTALQDFKDDHDWYHHVNGMNGNEPSQPRPNWVPERAVFGLPHAYQTRGGFQVTVSPRLDSAKGDPGRRASPLFLRLHSFANAPPAALLLHLESVFSNPRMPHGLAVRSTKKGSASQDWTINYWQPDHRIVRTFMNENRWRPKQ